MSSFTKRDTHTYTYKHTHTDTLRETDRQRVRATKGAILEDKATCCIFQHKFAKVWQLWFLFFLCSTGKEMGGWEEVTGCGGLLKSCAKIIC